MHNIRLDFSPFSFTLWEGCGGVLVVQGVGVERSWEWRWCQGRGQKQVGGSLGDWSWWWMGTNDGVGEVFK